MVTGNLLSPTCSITSEQYIVMFASLLGTSGKFSNSTGGIRVTHVDQGTLFDNMSENLLFFLLWLQEIRYLLLVHNKYYTITFASLLRTSGKFSNRTRGIRVTHVDQGTLFDNMSELVPERSA